MTTLCISAHEEHRRPSIYFRIHSAMQRADRLGVRGNILVALRLARRVEELERHKLLLRRSRKRRPRGLILLHPAPAANIALAFQVTAESFQRCPEVAFGNVWLQIE